jgi:hypothetical protein
VPGLIDHCLDSVLILRDHSHSPPDETGICAHCGQPLPTGHGHAHGYGDKRANWTGLAVTVLLHLLLLLAFLLRSNAVKPPAPAAGGAVTYVAPVASKPKPKSEPTRKRMPQRAPERVDMARLPDTITLPKELPVVQAEPKTAPEPPKPEVSVPVLDMGAMIEARQRVRARQQLEQRLEQSQAYIVEQGAPAANPGAGGTGEIGVKVMSLSVSSAELQFVDSTPGHPDRLINLKVSLGGEPDIETAVIQAMVDVIQATMAPDFEYTSGRGKKVTLSARKQDTAALFSFLMRRNFPKHMPARR